VQAEREREQRPPGLPPSSGAALGVGAGRGHRNLSERARDTHSATCRESMYSVRAHTKCSAKVGDRLAACSWLQPAFGCAALDAADTVAVRPIRSNPTHAPIFATFPWRPRRFVPAIYIEREAVCMCRSSCLPIHNESVMQAESRGFFALPLSTVSLVSDAETPALKRCTANVGATRFFSH
jgi:hypothetical protein